MSQLHSGRGGSRLSRRPSAPNDLGAEISPGLPTNELFQDRKQAAAFCRWQRSDEFDRGVGLSCIRTRWTRKHAGEPIT